MTATDLPVSGPGSSTTERIAALEQLLSHFDAEVRRKALAELAALVQRGEAPGEPERDVANMHAHTFFSFNAYGHSPSSLAWEARRRGYHLMGIVDFDVLDGVTEFLDACEALDVRGTAGLETRVYIPEFATREINSPGEPGISYHMGVGFTTAECPEEVRDILGRMRQRASRRNREMVGRLNPHLAPLKIDYARDVLPLTPAGNPTERHILQALITGAAARATNLASFWSERLGLSREQVEPALANAPAFQNLVRGKLMKRGGVGYVQPGPESFPSVEEVHRFVVACGAIPTITWLDGTSAGEQALEELVALLVGKGAAAFNIVPDRNWNIADPAARQLKVANLYKAVELARAWDLPINVGTEMNSPGQKYVDDFSAPELAPVVSDFMDGAHFVYGHTALQRWCGLGYQSAWAVDHLPTRRERNAFYTEAGKNLPPGRPGRAIAEALKGDMSPGDILAAVRS